MANKFAYTNKTKKEREAGTQTQEQRIESEKKASLYLHSQGVRGIKYYTGETRNKQKKDYNYVIFDDADVSITAKYSKRLATEQELEAEWKANAEVAPPEEDTIAIGGKKGDKKTISSVARAMSKIMGLGKISKMNDREIVIGKTGVEIQPSMDGQSLAWSSMRAVFQPQSYQ
jgi:hypothetical protein